MQRPTEHAVLLARRDFVIPPGDFTDAERELLVHYGRWLDALASGTIHPQTPGQAQFVMVARGQREPETDFERAWVKVMTQRNGVEEVVRSFQRLAHARAHAADVEAEYCAARAEVLSLVRDQLNAVDEAFAARVKATADESAEAEQSVRQLVLRLGRGVRLAGIRAAYYPGRVTWDTMGLDEYAHNHPDVSAFRKVGKAWVNLRFLSGNSRTDTRSSPAALPSAQEAEREPIKELPASGGAG
jgi:uncharacterized protein YifE (UPF0438 family)